MANIGTVEGTLRLKDELSSVLKKAAGEMDAMARQASVGSKAIADLSKQMEKMAKTPSLRADAAASAKSLAGFKAENRAIEENLAALRKGPAAVQALNDEREVMNRLIAAGVTRESAYGKEIEQQIRRQQKYRAELSKVTQELNKVAKAVDPLGERMQRLGRSLTDLGMQMTRVVTLPLVAVGGAAIKAASDFESSFAGVRKTVDATEVEFAALSQGIRDMAKAGPTGTTELNRIAEAAGQLGIRKEAILDFTRTVADLAVTTDLTSDSASNALARIANITGLAQDKFDNLGSAIVALGNAGASTESEIVNFSLRIAGAGEIAGLTEGEILAIGSAMASVGVEAEAGGTAVQKVLIGMTKSVAENGEQLALFAETAGMSAKQFAEAWRTDAAGAFTAFVEGLGQQGDKAFKTLDDLDLKDQRLVRSFLSLSQAGKLLSDQIALGNRSFQENAALAEEAQKRYQTFESQLKTFWNQVKDVGITLGTSLLPILRDVLDASKPLIARVEELTKWFSELPRAVQVAVLALAALAAAAGPVLVAVGALITLAGTAATTLAAIGAPMVAAAAAVAALSAVLAPLVAVTLKNWISGFRQLMGVTKETREFLSALASVIAKDVKAAFIALRDRIEETAEGAKHFLSEIQESHPELLKSVDALKDLWTWLGKVADRLDIVRSIVVNLGPALLNVGAATPLLQRWVEAADDLTRAQEGAAEETERWSEGLEDLGDAIPKELLDGAMAVEVERLRKKVVDLGTGTKKTAEELKKLADALEQMVDESLTPLEAAAKEYADAQKLINDAAAAGIQITDAQTAAVERLRLKYEELKPTLASIPSWFWGLGAGQVAGGGTGLPPGVTDTGGMSFDDAGALFFGDAALTQAATDYFDILRKGQKEGRDGWHNIRQEFGAWTQDLRGAMGDVGNLFGAFDSGIGRTIEGFANMATQVLAMFDSIESAGGKFAKGGAWAFAAAAAVSAAWSQFGGATGDRGTGKFGGRLSGDHSDTGAAVGNVVGTAIGAAVAAYYTGGLGAAEGGAIGGMIGQVIGQIVGTFIKRGADEGLAEISRIGGEIVTDVTKNEGGLGDLLASMGEGIAEFFSSLEEQLGTTIIDFPFFSLKVRDDIITVFIAGIRADFETVEEAMQFAITKALEHTKFAGGLSENIAAVLEKNVFESLDELDRALNVAMEVDRLGIPDFQLALKDDMDALRKLGEEMERLGGNAENVWQAMAKLSQTTRDSILGIVETERQTMEREAAGFNAERLRMIDEAIARKAEIAAELARAMEVAAIFGATLSQEELDHFAQRMAGVDLIISGLAPEITQADIDKALKPKGAGGGGRRAAREGFEGGLLDTIAQGMGIVDQMLDDYNAQVTEIQEQTKKLKGDTDLAAKAIEVLGKVLREDLMQTAADIGSSFGISTFATRLAARQLRMDLDAMAQAMLAAGASMDEVLQALGEANLNIFLGIAEGLAEQVGNEEQLKQLQDLRHQLELANYQLQIQQLEALGIISKAQANDLKALVFQWDQFFKGIDPNSGGGFGSGGSGAGDVPATDQWQDMGGGMWYNPALDRWEFRGTAGNDPFGGGPPAANDNSAMERALSILEAWENLGRTAFAQELEQLNEDFQILLDTFGRSPRVLAAAGLALNDLLERALAPVREFQEGLLFSEFSPLTLEQQFAEAQARFNELVALGDPADAAEIASMAQLLLGLGQQVLSIGGAGFQDLFFDVNNALTDFQQNAIVNAANQLDVSVDTLEVMRRTEVIQERMAGALERLEQNGGLFQNVVNL